MSVVVQPCIWRCLNLGSWTLLLRCASCHLWGLFFSSMVCLILHFTPSSSREAWSISNCSGCWLHLHRAGCWATPFILPCLQRKVQKIRQEQGTWGLRWAGLSACLSRSLVQGRVDGRAVCGLTSCLVLPGHMNWGESAVPDSTPGPLLRPLDSPFPPSWLWSTTRACLSGCRSVVMEHLGSVVSPFTLP